MVESKVFATEIVAQLKDLLSKKQAFPSKAGATMAGLTLADLVMSIKRSKASQKRVDRVSGELLAIKSILTLGDVSQEEDAVRFCELGLSIIESWEACRANDSISMHGMQVLGSRLRILAMTANRVSKELEEADEADTAQAGT